MIEVKVVLGARPDVSVRRRHAFRRRTCTVTMNDETLVKVALLLQLVEERRSAER